MKEAKKTAAIFSYVRRTHCARVRCEWNKMGIPYTQLSSILDRVSEQANELVHTQEREQEGDTEHDAMKDT